jgi:putative tryptophan/tyrosine transport system substrate-binding protein
MIEYRWAEGNTERLPELAADLVRRKVDVIVAVGPPSAEAAHQATRTIPIVILGVGDPVALGLAPSLSRPGGNVTGYASYGRELVGKT